MKRLPLPCPSCGGVVSLAPVKCQRCSHTWNHPNHFYGDSYEYKLAAATVEAHDPGDRSPTAHIFAVLELMQQAQRYLAAITIPRADEDITAVIDGETIKLSNADQLADAVTALWRPT